MDIIACQRGKSNVHHLLGNASFGLLHPARELCLKIGRNDFSWNLIFFFLRFYDLLLTFYCM